jgi:hypothetical protein
MLKPPLFSPQISPLRLAARHVRGIEANKHESDNTLNADDPENSMNAPRKLTIGLSRTLLVTAALGSLAACGGGNDRPTADLAAAQVTTIGVNSYLWRASLDTVAFAPLLQADSAGGVIVTDWYTNPANPGERVKVTVTILDQDLRADALRVAASRQTAQGGAWVDAPVQAATVQKLEDIILTKARDLRRQSVAS